MPRLALACFVAISILGVLVAPHTAYAQDHQLRVGLDVDLDDSTGCSLEGADDSGSQVATGFEWLFRISITPLGETLGDPSAQVVEVEKFGCDDAETRTDMAWQSHGSDTTSWNVGIDLGEDPGGGVSPGDVVELEIETAEMGISGVVRLAVLSESADGHRDTLLTMDGSSAGESIVFPGAEYVPALSSGALGLLLLFFLASTLIVVRRSPWTLALWIAVLGLSAERGLASITLVVDGNVGDWGSLFALASDPVEDSEEGDPSADILALFVDWSGSHLAVRVDVADLATEMCQHPHATSPCYYASANGSAGNDGDDSSSPWDLATALEEVPDGGRLLIAAGDYTLEGLHYVGEEGVRNGIHVIAEDGVRLHNTIEAFTEVDGWTHIADEIYVSVDSLGTAAELASANLSGRFTVDDEAFMLMPYQCSEVFENSDFFYDSSDNDIDCDEAPYIGPGLYLDVDGSYGDALEAADPSLAPIGEGHLFLRMDTSPEPLNSIVASEGWATPIDPNTTVMEITIDGPRLQLEGNDLVVRNLKMELGSLRMGGDTSGNEVRNVELDGPTYDAPIEIYSGGSETILDGLTIDQNFAPWITWQDTKHIFEGSIRFSAISFGASAGTDEPLHDIVLRNSTLRNVHDGLELNLDAYHHISIVDNTFANVQDDAIQLGSSPYEIEIAGNRMEEVGTGVSRHGTGANAFPGYKYIHHNYIDASTPKYYCRETAPATYSTTTCDSAGKLTLRGFHLHNGSGWSTDGDPRYYYNNTVIVNGQMVGVGFQGQDYETELPYEQPSLVFNNVFVQLDETESLVVESPMWSIAAPPVLILGGNLYYQPDPPETIFKMSGDTCGLEDFQLDHCKGGGSWSPQIAPIWAAYSSATVLFSWGLEEGGLEDGTELDLETYVPGCTWLGAQVDGSGDVIEPIDLASIDGGYSVSVDGVEEWTLSLTKPLPGLDPGDPYRGWTPCSE